MKQFISVFLSAVLISLVACGTAKVEIIPEGTELSGTLEISVMDNANDYTGWYPLVEGFKKLHPDVTVVLSDTSADDESETAQVSLDKYLNDLRVRLFSGDTPDLVFLSSDLVSEFSGSDLFVDINELIGSDESFKKEDYYMNVVESYEIRGELYAIPTTFMFRFARFREDIMDSLDIDMDAVHGVDYNFIYGNYNKAVENGDFPSLKYILREPYNGKDLLSVEEETACFNSEEMQINFESEQYINYLNTSRDYEAPMEFGFFITATEDKIFSEDNYFTDGITSDNRNLTKIIGDIENVTKAVPVTASSGELLVYGGHLGSIPKSAKNPELAWEFIKYCIYESDTVSLSVTELGKWGGDRFFSYIPINKNNFKKQLNATAYSDEQIEQYLNAVNSALELEIARIFPMTELHLSLREIKTDFYNGLMTAKECAKAMQDRAEIYFAEIE